jgi:hypothetical protein
MLSADRWRDFSGSVAIIGFALIPIPEMPLYFGCHGDGSGWQKDSGRRRERG